MINLRYHIFSLIAVFVALAIGIAAGSTVVKGPLLDSLRSRLESAEQRIGEERDENDRLTDRLSQLDELAIVGPQQFLAGKLADTTVVVVAAPGASDGAVRGLRDALAAAGAQIAAEVRLEARAFDPERAESVAQAIGATSVEPEAVATAFGELLGRDLIALEAIAAAADAGPGDVRPPLSAVVDSVFGAIEDAGLIDIAASAAAPLAGAHIDVVLVSGRTGEVDPGRALGALIATMLDVDTPATLVAAEDGLITAAGDTTVPSLVAAVRDDGRLRDEVSTVDNAESFVGWAATVLALEPGRRGDVGHYGFRAGRDELLPPALVS